MTQAPKQIQCMCGWWAPTKPQHLWTKEEVASAYAHQQAHLEMQRKSMTVGETGTAK